jgi:hypothetical protein
MTVPRKPVLQTDVNKKEMPVLERTKVDACEAFDAMAQADITQLVGQAQKQQEKIDAEQEALLNILKKINERQAKLEKDKATFIANLDKAISLPKE